MAVRRDPGKTQALREPHLTSNAENQQLSHKHHYIPCFYSKKWAAHDGKLVEFSRPFRKLVCARKAPKAVGFRDDLYTLTGLKPAYQTILEDRFFRTADQQASNALERLLDRNREGPISEAEQVGFARFIMSLFHRTPDRVAALQSEFMRGVDEHLKTLKAEVLEGKFIELPEGVSLEQVVAHSRFSAENWRWGELLRRLVDSPFLGEKLLGMMWTVKWLDGDSYPLLTSDKPLVHTNGLAQDEAQLLLSLSPRALFIATNNRRTRDDILELDESVAASRFNDQVTRQAIRYVYASDMSQERFIGNRLGKSGC